MTNSLKIAVLHGGPSSEHAISVWSAQGAIAALRELGHDVHPVYVGRDSHWYFSDGHADAGATTANPIRLWAAIELLSELSIDVCFMGFHGTFGEDGKVQAALELVGLRYTGSGVAASAVAMDKLFARRVYQGVGIPVAAAVEQPTDTLDELQGARIAASALADQLGLPLVVKVPAGGSSIGVEIPKTVAEVTDSLQRLSVGVGHLLCEAYVTGTELTAGVLQTADGRLTALPIVEIVPRIAGFFDQAAKYQKGGSDEIVPARISAAAAVAVQDLGLRAHRALGCRGVSRTDVILRADGQPVVLETNTLPGLTPASLLPKAAAAAGKSYRDLIGAIVDAAL